MSEASDLKARFSLVRLSSSRHAKLQQLVANRKWGDAHDLAEKLGIPLTRGVYRMETARARLR